MSAREPEVLVCDDDLDIAALLQTCLEEEGYRVRVVHYGLAVLDAVMQHRPDLVLLDVMMPGLSGWQVWDGLQEMVDPPPVIFCTAISDVRSRAAMIRRGADDFIVKPFDTGELLARVARALRRDHRRS